MVVRTHSEYLSTDIVISKTSLVLIIIVTVIISISTYNFVDSKLLYSIVSTLYPFSVFTELRSEIMELKSANEGLKKDLHSVMHTLKNIESQQVTISTKEEPQLFKNMMSIVTSPIASKIVGSMFFFCTAYYFTGILNPNFITFDDLLVLVKDYVDFDREDLNVIKNVTIINKFQGESYGKPTTNVISLADDVSLLPEKDLDNAFNLLSVSDELKKQIDIFRSFKDD
jgi:hypothetical protein